MPNSQPSGLRRALSAVGRAAAATVRGTTYLARAGQAHQHFFLPVLNGALGDQLAARGDARAIQMSFRRAGRDVPVAELGLTEVRQKTLVFVPGLMGDELIWQTGFQDAAPHRRYGPRLVQEAGVRCLYLRYNTGLHLSENGQALNQLLTELINTYPDQIGELVLVGHSMGGLIIRSAGYYAKSYELGVMSYELVEDAADNLESQEETLETKKKEENKPSNPTQNTKPQTHNSKLITHNSTWLPHLRAVVLLGTPNDGSWLEQNSHFTARLLERINLFPTRFLSRALNQRSNGIKDLRHSILVEADWRDPHANDLLPPRTPVPPLPGVAYHILLGSWLKTALPSALRQYFGDGLVGRRSALGGATFADEANLPPGTTVRLAEFSQQHHGGLLTHPEVLQYLKTRV